MKIEQVEAKVFHHSTNQTRDSDGHSHPGPVSQTTTGLLVITCDDGTPGHVIARPGDVEEPLLEKFVRPVLLGQDPMRSERLWQAL
jgi:L-alanine-DL-glutamate epimerase-like enolase superfamily enzyme